MDSPNEFSSPLSIVEGGKSCCCPVFVRPARRLAETSLESSKGYDVAFRAVDVDVLVNGPGGEETRVPSLWAGGRTCKWRFSSSEPSVYRYLTEANDTTNSGLHGVWTEAEGAKQHADVATTAGPGGLWIDNADNIYLTVTDEHEVQPLSPAGELTPIARGTRTATFGSRAIPSASKTANVVARVTTRQKALTNVVFSRKENRSTLYLSSSDMDHVTGYIYKATVETPEAH